MNAASYEYRRMKARVLELESLNRTLTLENRKLRRELKLEDERFGGRKAGAGVPDPGVKINP